MEILRVDSKGMPLDICTPLEVFNHPELSRTEQDLIGYIFTYGLVGIKFNHDMLVFALRVTKDWLEEHLSKLWELGFLETGELELADDFEERFKLHRKTMEAMFAEFNEHNEQQAKEYYESMKRFEGSQNDLDGKGY